MHILEHMHTHMRTHRHNVCNNLCTTLALHSTVPLHLTYVFSSLPLTQLAAELQEKVRVLDNEIEILRTSVENKERLLQDFGKQVHMQTELSAELEQQVRGVRLASVLREK